MSTPHPADGPLDPTPAPTQAPAQALADGPQAPAGTPAGTRTPATAPEPAARDTLTVDHAAPRAAVPRPAPAGPATSAAPATSAGSATPAASATATYRPVAPGAAAALGVTPGTVLPDPAPVHEVRNERDLDQAVGVLTTAFLDDPVITWLVPRGMPGRECYIAGFMRSWTRFMLEHEGRAVLSQNRDAVLVWEPSQRAVPLTETDRRAFRADVTTSTGLTAARCLALIDLLDANRPPDLPPHAHGALAAVLPGVAGQGAIQRLGLELLRYVHSRTWGIYCEASSDSDAELWRRLGGTPVGRPIPLPGSDAVLTPLYLSAETLAVHPAVPLLW